jgi:hypothetical protein
MARRALEFWRVHRHEMTRGAATVLLLVLVLSFQGSIGSSQMEAVSPVLRIAAATGGELSPEAVQALRRRLPGHVLDIADRDEVGRPTWFPEGPLGWPIYDIERIPTLLRHSLSIDQARQMNALVPDSPVVIRPMPGFVLPASNVAERDRALLCLAQAVYFEAGFESGAGQQAVAQVVLNRLRHPAYPKSVCGVVYQGSQRSTGCQFSFTCDGSLNRPVSQAAWERSKEVARAALQGFVYKPVGSATHYHADYVFPYWAVTLVKLRQLGAHVFYRMTGPNGQPSAFSGLYSGGEMSLSAAVLRGGDSRTPDAPTVIAEQASLIQGPVTRTVTLAVAGEVRTYTVQDPAAPGGVTTRVAGAILPSRRAATADEIREINEKMKQYDPNAGAPAGAPVVVPPPPPPLAPAPEPKVPQTK